MFKEYTAYSRKETGKVYLKDGRIVKACFYEDEPFGDHHTARRGQKNFDFVLRNALDIISLHEKKDFDEILELISKHDKKSYKMAQTIIEASKKVDQFFSDPEKVRKLRESMEKYHNYD